LEIIEVTIQRQAIIEIYCPIHGPVNEQFSYIFIGISIIQDLDISIKRFDIANFGDDRAILQKFCSDIPGSWQKKRHNEDQQGDRFFFEKDKIEAGENDEAATNKSEDLINREIGNEDETGRDGSN